MNVRAESGRVIADQQKGATMSRLHLSVLLVGPWLLVSAGLMGSSAPDPSTSAPHPEQPPLAHTGGFGEPTCHACHFGGSINGGEGTVSVKGLPQEVQSGTSYRLSVQLTASMERAGFMLAVRGPDGTQVGRLAPIDTGRVVVRTVDSTGVQYAHHTLSGTELTGENTSTWSLRWFVPDGGCDTATVHVSANAANDDASEFGDAIYTREVGTHIGK